MKRTRSGRAFNKTSAIARPAAAEKAQKGVRGTFGERGQTAIERIACRENAPEGRKKTEPDENGAKIRKAALVTESGFQREIQICGRRGRYSADKRYSIAIRAFGKRCSLSAGRGGARQAKRISRSCAVTIRRNIDRGLTAA